MIGIRMPACDTKILLAGNDIASGNTTKRGQNNEDILRSQGLISGNKCNHDKNKIKMPFFHRHGIPSSKHPHVIEEFIRRLRFISSIYPSRTSGKHIIVREPIHGGPSKNNLSIFESEGLKKLLFHQTKNGKRRRRRSERVESALFLTLSTIVYSTDLFTMFFGYRNKRNEVFHYNYGYIISQTGLSKHRLYRSIAILKELGLIRVDTEKKKNDDSSWRTTKTKIQLSDEVFALLGLTDEFRKDREYAARKFHKAEQILIKRNAYMESFARPLPNKIRHKKILSVPFSGKNSINSILNKGHSIHQDKDHGRKVMERIRQIIDSEKLSPQEAIAKANKEFYQTIRPPDD